MPLREAARFGRKIADPPGNVVAKALAPHARELAEGGWLYCGYTPLPPSGDLPERLVGRHVDVDRKVDNGFRLRPRADLGSIVTTGFRTSRFAPILFWEVLHALRPGGLWVDIDLVGNGAGSALGDEDYPAREYFRSRLTPRSTRQEGGALVRTFRRTAVVPERRPEDDGWTFGILTASAASYAARMAADILALDLPRVEVIVCGPRPAGLPDDERIRTIDLDQPEPRGWITRKKNLLAEAARYDRLCLLHDRYVVSPDWAAALRDCGDSLACMTFPQTYYADRERRFPHRYPDYQMVHEPRRVREALAAGIYEADRVFCPAYDDFSETAFCCGGLYIVARDIWNQVGQDEGLFHCEWEDISFGLECQRRGIPHRVNMLAAAESTTPHALALTRLDELRHPARAERGRLHVVPEQADAARRTPAAFKPIVPTTREAYYAKVRDRFNRLPGLREADRLPADIAARCERLSDFWREIEGRASRMALVDRAHISALCFFLSDVVYKWPNCQVTSWIREFEDADPAASRLAPDARIVAWGTGSLFRARRAWLRRPLAYAVDSRPETWGHHVDGVPVMPPDTLLAEDPRGVAVVVFSCFADEIEAAVRERGPFVTVRAADLQPAGPLRVIRDLIGYFEEVERYYPVVFEHQRLEAAA